MEGWVYQRIQQIFKECKRKDEYLRNCRKNFPRIPDGTFSSIYSQSYQQLMKREHPKYRKSEVMEELYQRYCKIPRQDESVLVDLANEYSLSPVLYARIILEKHAEHFGFSEEGLSSVVNQWLKEPEKLLPLQLSQQVIACIVQDTEYGPLGDNIKHSLGHEYEYYLSLSLREHFIPYLDEVELRKRNYDKTPDFKLECPIMVSGVVVNWIESKAMFGDVLTHSTHLDKQLRSYVNRFGPGMVIYWYGYQQDVMDGNGILIRDSLPTHKITLMSYDSKYT